MRTITSAAPLILLTAVCFTNLAHGQATKTHEVKAEPFEVQVELSSVFVAENTAKISVEPQSWSQFKVAEIVPHGAQVSSGEVLVRFDTEEIDKAIEDMAMDQQLAELSIIQAEEELPRVQRSLNLQYEAAARALRTVQEDLQRWRETDRPLLKKSAEFSLKDAQQYLEYQQEELRQLEKMYEADDLTEETEEIILKRQRNAVEAAKFDVERAEIRHDETLNVRLSRMDDVLKNTLEQAELAHARAKTAREISANEQQFSLQKAKHQRQRSLEKHADLLADRELMTIKSPMDGVVYYGREVDGKWSGLRSMAESLQPGGSVSPRSIFMTVVQLRPLKVLGNFGEKHVDEVEAGAPAVVIPAADEEMEVSGNVVDVSKVPVASGQFSVEVELADELPEWVVPGMTCTVKITTYKKEDALTVPQAAVRSDEDDDQQKYVLVQVADEDEPQRRDVKTGKTNNGKTEILEGLSAGEKVVLGDPETESGADEKSGEEERDRQEEDGEDAEGAAGESRQSSDDEGSSEGSE